MTAEGELLGIITGAIPVSGEGPFTHLFTPSAPRPLRVSATARRGRWPGLVAILEHGANGLDNASDWLAARRPPWRWLHRLLHGNQVTTTWTFPHVDVTVEGGSWDLAGGLPARGTVTFAAAPPEENPHGA